jgi:ABC-type polysaccharide/polyol phosphate export permease
LQILFFVTPIFWTYDQLQGKTGYIIINSNILLQYVEIIRAPLLGRTPSMYSWCLVLSVTFLGWAVAIPLYARYRARIAYWL